MRFKLLGAQASFLLFSANVGENSEKIVFVRKEFLETEQRPLSRIEHLLAKELDRFFVMLNRVDPFARQFEVDPRVNRLRLIRRHRDRRGAGKAGRKCHGEGQESESQEGSRSQK